MRLIPPLFNISGTCTLLNLNFFQSDCCLYWDLASFILQGWGELQFPPLAEEEEEESSMIISSRDRLGQDPLGGRTPCFRRRRLYGSINRPNLAEPTSCDFQQQPLFHARLSSSLPSTSSPSNNIHTHARAYPRLWHHHHLLPPPPPPLSSPMIPSPSPLVGSVDLSSAHETGVFWGHPRRRFFSSALSHDGRACCVCLWV